MVIAGHVGGTRGPGIVSSAADVLWMSVGFEELVEYVRCVCVWLGAAWVVRGLGLDFINPGGTGGLFDVCLCFGCGDVGGVGGEWVGALTRVWKGVVVLCLCEEPVCIICVDGRSRYLCIVLGGYLRI